MLSKKEQYEQVLQEIVLKNTSLKIIHEKYVKFNNTQTIYKKVPKKSLDTLINLIENKLINEFLNKKVSADSLIEYNFMFNDYAMKVSDKWNYEYKLPFIRFNFVKSERLLTQKFDELNPTMARADELVMALFNIPEGFKNFKTEIVKELQNTTYKNYYERINRWLLVVATAKGIDVIPSGNTESINIFNKTLKTEYKCNFKYSVGKNTWNYPLNC